MPKFRDPKFLLLPLVAVLIYSVLAGHPSSASAVGFKAPGFVVVATPLATAEPNIDAKSWFPPKKAPFVVLSEFLRPTSDWGAGHRGIDFESQPTEPLLTPHAGSIRLAGQVFGVSTVVIEHENQTSSVFQPVCLNSGLATGDRLTVGQPFGHFCLNPGESSHCGALSCVHWSFRLGREVYLNPLRFLQMLAPSSLKPLGRISEL